ncbi:MAG: trans-sialidase, partial [Nitrosotalea sp.]
SGEVSPTYAKLSSTGYSGNKYFATRPRLSYHPANKQFKGEATKTIAAQPEPAKPKTMRGTLPAGFKP